MLKDYLKKILLSLFVVSPYKVYTQQSVGINTDSPYESTILDIESKNSNMGVVFPNVYLNSVRDSITIPNPKESLLVYNKNKTLFGRESLVYWSGEEWVNLMSGKDLFKDYPYQDVYSLYAYDYYDNKPKAYSPEFYDKYPFHIGDNISEQWTVIDDFTKRLSFNARDGKLLISFWGGVQGSESAFMNASIGVFIDDKLEGIKTFSRKFIPPSFTSQLYFDFWIDGVSLGLHTLKIAIRNNYRSSSALRVTYGGQENKSFEDRGNWNPVGNNENILGVSVLLIN